jgi:hypothetical protein
MNNIMAEKLKIKIPEGFGPKENCVACNGTGTKYLISLFDGKIYHKREGRCHCFTES